MKAFLSLYPAISVVFGFCSYGSQSVPDWARQVEVGNQFVETGELNRAAVAYTTALEHARVAGDDVRAGVVLLNLGRLFERQGRTREAEQSFLAAISKLKRGSDTRLLVRAYVGLSTVYIQTGEDSRAETLIRNVLADHPAGADPERASVSGNLVSFSCTSSSSRRPQGCCSRLRMRA